VSAVSGILFFYLFCQYFKIQTDPLFYFFTALLKVTRHGYNNNKKRKEYLITESLVWNFFVILRYYRKYLIDFLEK